MGTISALLSKGNMGLTPALQRCGKGTPAEQQVSDHFHLEDVSNFFASALSTTRALAI